MPAKTFRLKIVHDGREFEAEGDKDFVLQMLKEYGPCATDERRTSSVERAAGKTSEKGRAVTLSTAKSISIREFIQQLDLKKHTDITLAFAYYLEKHQGVSKFTPADINNCYYEAKLEFSNTSQMIIQNIKRGFLMASRNKEAKGKNGYDRRASRQSKLLLKECVRASGKSIYKSPKETITIWGAYEILADQLKITIPEKPDLELLHEERNNIQHKYANPRIAIAKRGKAKGESQITE